MCFPGGSDDKESACNSGDPGSIPKSGRSPGGGHGSSLQYSILGWRIPWTEEPGGLQSMGSQFSSVQLLSCVRLFATPWILAYQASLLMGFSGQEYWSGLLFPSPGDLPNPGIEPRSPLQVDSLSTEPHRFLFF